MEGLNEVFQPPENVPEELREQLLETLEKMKNHIATRGENYQWSRKDFDIGCLLGKGKFGRVYLARDVHCHLPFALKLMHKSEIMKHNCERQVLREIEIQTNLRHPNILTLYSYFDDQRFIYLVLEFASQGELYGHLTNSPNSRFPPARAAKYLYQMDLSIGVRKRFWRSMSHSDAYVDLSVTRTRGRWSEPPQREVVSALEYCHKKQVIHRDIKPENILLAEDDNIKLSDFGWSVHATSSTRRTMCGTLDYLPPEMVSNESYDQNVDNWCVGVLLYEFLTGKAPFETPTQDTTYVRITSLDYKFPDYVPAGARDLIQRLLRLRGTDRLALMDVQTHPWIEETYPESDREHI